MSLAAILDTFTTKRAAVAAVREEANALIEQAERRAKGFDRGAWRDDLRAVDRNTVCRSLGASVTG